MSEPTFALDLGTTKFCLARALGAISEGDGVQVECVSVPADGMHRGMLSDIAKAKKALETLIDLAEKKFGCDITKVSVGVAGSHISSRLIECSVDVNEDSIDDQLIDKLDNKVVEYTKKPDREVVHNVPIRFRIDGRPWIANPLGFSGRRLTGRFIVIEADRDYLSDIVTVCNQSGLEVTSLVAEPYASAVAITTDARRQAGVVICDIGGGTTDGIVYKDGAPTAVFTINIGGKLMTKDLSIGLGVDIKNAEALKRKFGLAALKNDSEVDTIRDIDGALKKVNAAAVFRILAPRIHELGCHIKKQIAHHGIDPATRIMVTGGGSQVRCLSDYFVRALFPEVDCVSSKTLESRLIDLPSSQYDSPSIYATVAGLVCLEREKQEKAAVNEPSGWVNQHLSQFLGWLRELR